MIISSIYTHTSESKPTCSIMDHCVRCCCGLEAYNILTLTTAAANISQAAQ